MNRGFTLIELVIAVAVILGLLVPGFIGWGMNIYKLTKCDFEAPFKSEVIRIIGIPVVPVGMVVGYCKIEDKEEK